MGLEQRNSIVFSISYFKLKIGFRSWSSIQNTSAQESLFYITDIYVIKEDKFKEGL